MRLRFGLLIINFFFVKYLLAQGPDPDLFLQFKINEYYLNVNPKPDSLTYVNCDYIQKKLLPSEIFIDFFETGMNEEVTCWLIIVKKDRPPFVIRFPAEGSPVVNTNGDNESISAAQRAKNDDKFFLQVREYLNGINTIFYSLSRSYWLTNIKFFTDDKGDFLFEKYRMVRLNSGASFLGNNHRLILRPSFNLLLIGGVDYSCDIPEEKLKIDTWKYLPGSSSEINEIKNIFEKNHSVSCLDSCKATEKNLAKILSDSDFEIIHFATHGFYFGRSDDRVKTKKKEYNFNLSESGIVLSGANHISADLSPFNQMGLLTALELKSFNMAGTKLVVLSICHSGKGNNQLTTLPLGLPLAFLRLGVRGIIVSNKAISDEHSSIFMRTLYSFINSNYDIDDCFNFTLNKLHREQPSVDWSFFDLIH